MLNMLLLLIILHHIDASYMRKGLDLYYNIHTVLISKPYKGTVKNPDGSSFELNLYLFYAFLSISSASHVTIYKHIVEWKKLILNRENCHSEPSFLMRFCEGVEYCYYKKFMF